MRPRHLLVPLLTAALAACGDRAAPTLPDAGGPAPGSAPAASRLAGREGHPGRGDVRTGFITRRNGSARQVTYEVHGGLAIWEGDIVLGRAVDVPATLDEWRAARARPRRPGGPSYGVTIDGNVFRWPGGVIPFEIAANLPNQQRVTDAIAMVEQATPGVTLVPRNGEDDFVRFVLSDGCSSEIGRIGGQQNINLGPNCTTGNAAHEILHALGMYHEHTRCDRDAFVEVIAENIEDGKAHNFTKNCEDATDDGDYDEGSIMHYGPFFFSKNDLPTLRSLRDPPRDGQMGQRAALGPTDVATIALLYGANNDAPTAAIAPHAVSYAEGFVVPFDGRTSSDPDDAVLTYRWDFGDGSCGGAPPPAACTAALTSHAYADEGTYSASLTVGDGFLNDVEARSVVITNVAPVVSLGAATAALAEGGTFVRAGSFTDPGADAWTATVNWGDGTPAGPLTLSGKTFSLSHPYADNGVYTATVQVSDGDGGVGQATVTVTVTNVAPTVSAGADATVTSGQTYNLSGTFTDPGVNDAPWSWLITWGFGPNSTGSTNTLGGPIQASRQACAAGTYTVTLAVTDKDGGTGSDALTLTVPFLAVTLDIMPSQHPNPIALDRKGLVPVAVLSTPTFDATRLDPSKTTLGDGAGADVPVDRLQSGRWQAKAEDVNGDGRADLLLMFDNARLVGDGEVTAGSTELVLRGFLDDACTNVRGAGPIVVR